MYWRACRFARLAELPDQRLFAALEHGLTLVGQNVARLTEAAATLVDTGRVRPANILASHATDETGKFLILLDAARCPRAQLAAHLTRAGHHLSRFLFADVATCHFVTFGEVVEYIDRNRKSHYLDGPEGIEWVYRNTLLYWREQAMYVDYVEMEDRSCQWQDPDHFEKLDGALWKEPWTPRVVEDLISAGLHQADALGVIAHHWRGFAPDANTHVGQTGAVMTKMMADLDRRGLLRGDQNLWERVADRWAFPLWGAETSLMEVKLNELLEERERYSPEY